MFAIVLIKKNDDLYKNTKLSFFTTVNGSVTGLDYLNSSSTFYGLQRYKSIDPYKLYF